MPLDLEPFLATVAYKPYSDWGGVDSAFQGALADYLEEQGYPLSAQFVRIATRGDFWPWLAQNEIPAISVYQKLLGEWWVYLKLRSETCAGMFWIVFEDEEFAKEIAQPISQEWGQDMGEVISES